MVKTVRLNYLKNRIHKQDKKLTNMQLYNMQGERILTSVVKIKSEVQNHSKQTKNHKKLLANQNCSKFCR